MKKRTGYTSDHILDLAEKLIQTRGYSAFSYQDIAVVLGIAKASIHYHFYTKTDLGIAVIERYATTFEKALAAAITEETNTSQMLFDFYTAPFLKFAKTPDRVCLCGALAGEMLSLPKEMQRRVDIFFKAHQAWLAKILERGKARNEITLKIAPAKTARLIFGALQGGLLVKRATGDDTQLKDVVQALKAQLFV